MCLSPELTNHQSVLRTLKWMLQKDLLGQDMFLIGPPGHFRRTVCMKYLSVRFCECIDYPSGIVSHIIRHVLSARNCVLVK